MYDSQQMAEQEAQALRDIRKTASSQGPKVALPNGIVADAVDYIGFTYGYHDEYGHLAEGHKLLESPNPKSKYAWPKLDDARTVSRMRQGLYRAVRPEELKEDAGGAIRTHEGVTGKYVCWYGHVLVEITEKADFELYGKPAKFAVSRLANNAAQFQDGVSSVARGVQGTISVTSDGHG